MVWASLGSDANPQVFTVHATNVEMMLRIAEASGRTVQSTDVDDAWIVVEFGVGSEAH